MTNWLYVEPYTLLFRTDCECLFYNTLNHESLLININQDIDGIVESLLQNKCIVFTEEMGTNDNVTLFVDQLQNTFNGDVIPVEADEQIRPAVFSPVINNQRAFEKLDSYTWMNMNTQVMEYLEEISLYINGLHTEEELLSDLYKQTPCYIKTKERIDIRKIISFLSEIKDKQVNKVNILGGDPFSCEKIEEVIKIVSEKASIINYYYRYDQWRSEYLTFVQDESVRLTIILPIGLLKHMPVDDVVIKSVSTEKKDTEFVFLIQSDEELEIAEKLIKKHHLRNYQWKPVFNGSNIAFFQENIYTDKDDFAEIKLSKRQIYSNEKINNNDFGRITILPDGNVYANTNLPPIGTISDRIQDLLYFELSKGHSWLRIRNQAPCNNCVYQYLCPPPSNYELVIGKPNLCHIKP